MTPEEDLKILAQEAQKIKDGLIVETGTHHGNSAKVLAKNSINSTVITIDVQDIHRDLPFNVLFLWGDSKDVVKKWNRPIDLLFIDGGHDYLTVQSDFFGFGKWVKPKGTILLHDYKSGRNADVTRFVHNHLNNKKYKAIGKLGEMLYKFKKCVQE